MNTQQFQRMSSGTGFIAALDQSGGSTPKALATYGIEESTYSSEVEMYDLVHQMRTRLITSPVFTSERILAAILFKQTMRSQIRGLDTADYLWQEKGIVPLLKIDNGLADEADGVQLMKPIPELNELLDEAKSHNIFGTKMRSVIKANNPTGIQTLVKQQFAFAKQICATGLVPIIEPEVDIHAEDKAAIEAQLMQALLEDLDLLGPDELVMLKLTLPTELNLYQALAKHPNVVRVVALSGGYERTYANELLAQNNGIIASFSRALSEGLYAYQSDEDFNDTLNATIEATYQASLT